MLVSLLVGLAAGCQQAAGPTAVDSGPGSATSSGPLGSTPASEDPQAAAYFKKKGWLLMRDLRISDGKPVVVLAAQDQAKPFAGVTLNPDDYKMLARSKTVQLLDLRKVKNTTDEGLKAVAGIPQLQGLVISGDAVTDAGLKALAQCKSLDSVSLMTKNVTDAGVKELAALPKLRWLYLFGMTLTGSGFEAFAGSKTLESISTEYVDGLTDEGIKHLAKLPALNELKIGKGFGESKLTAAGIKAIVDAHMPARFEFDRKLLDDDLLAALVKKGWLYGTTPPGAKEKRPATPEEVKTIVLDGSKVTDRGLRALLNCTNTTSMHLERTGVTDETLQKLSGFKKLSYLTLGQTKVTGAGLDALAGLPVKHLALEGCELSEDAFKALGKLAALEDLSLSRAKMKSAWLQHIAGLPQLKDLSLLEADFDDAAVKHVAKLPSLHSLSLNGTKLGDAGFLELLKLPQLRSLYVDGTNVSAEVYRTAKKEHPKLTLYFYRYDK
jgi:hypothetical protein